MTYRKYQTLPDKLANELRRLDWRVRALAAVRGIGVLCAVAGAAVATGLLVDWAIDLGVAVRSVLLLTAITGCGVTFAAAIVRPLFRRTTASELAALVDAAHPELSERIESAVELSDPSLPEQHRGSPLMRSRLLEETIDEMRVVDFRDAAEPTSARRWAAIGCVAVVLLLTPFGVSQDGYGLLLARFLAPWKNLERATNLYFVIEDADRTVARGSDVTITAQPHWRVGQGTLPGHAWLHWRNGNREADERRMEYDAESSTFQAMIPHVLTPFDYEVSAGRARTRTYHIDVVEAPAVERLTLEIEPPAYTGRAARTLDGPVGRIEVFERSRLTFHIECSKPVIAAELVWSDADDDPQSSANALPFALDEGRRSGSLTMTADRGGPFRIAVRDAQGVSNLEVEEQTRQLAVISDRPPDIRWADDGRTLQHRGGAIAVRPDGRLPLPVFARDDIAIAELELHAELVQHSEKLEPLIADTAGLGLPEVEHTFSWDLSRLSLQDGDLLAVRARALDGRPVPEPQEAWTEARLIRIAEEAPSIEESLLAQQQQRLRDILEAVQENVRQDRKTTESLKQSAQEAIEQQQPPAFQEEIAELADREQDLVQQLEHLAAVFAEHPLRQTIAQPTREVGRGPLKAAREQFQQAAYSPPARQREQLTNAADELARADQQLQRLLKQFDELAALERDLQRLQQFADEAERLSEDVAQFEHQWQQLAQAKQLAEQQRQQLEDTLGKQHDELQTEQQALAGALDRLLEERPEVLEAATERQRARLQELAVQASRLAEREDRLADVLERPPEASTPPEPSSPTDVAQQQQQLAEEAALLALETAHIRGVESPQAADARQFAEHALQSADEAQSGLLSDAADSAARAAEAAGQSAERLQNPTDPAPAELREQAARLAERQASLSEQLTQQADSPSARQQAQAAGQRYLAEQTAGLSEQLQQISERLGSEPVNDPEQSGRASAAQRAAQQASQSMQAAQQELQQGQAQAAVPQAREAAESLREAARQSGRLEDASEPDPPSPVPGDVGEQVADARSQLQHAGEQLRRNAPSREQPEPNDEPPAEQTTEESEPTSSPEELPDDEPIAEDAPPVADHDAPPVTDAKPLTPQEGERDSSPQPGESNASQSMKQVAESLRQAARQLGIDTSPSNQPGPSSESAGDPTEGSPGTQSGAGGRNPISLAEFEAQLGRLSTRDWGQLPGRVESELFQSTQKRPDGDYARLIRLYFEEISRRRSATDGLVPNQNEQ